MDKGARIPRWKQSILTGAACMELAAIETASHPLTSRMLSLRPRAFEGGQQPLRLRLVVQAPLVEQNIDDLDPRESLTDRQPEECRHHRMAKLHVDGDDGRRVPRRFEAC